MKELSTQGPCARPAGAHNCQGPVRSVLPLSEYKYVLYLCYFSAQPLCVEFGGGGI